MSLRIAACRCPACGVFETLPSQMLSEGYWAAVSASNGLNLGRGSSRVLTNSHIFLAGEFFGGSVTLGIILKKKSK